MPGKSVREWVGGEEVIGALLCLIGRHDWRWEWYYHNPLMQGWRFPMCDRCARCRAVRNVKMALCGSILNLPSGHYVVSGVTIVSNIDVWGTRI